MVITYVPNPNAADGRGVSITGNIFTWDGDPNGNVSCTGPGQVNGSGSSIGQIWLKVSAGTSNLDWFKVVG